MSKWRPGSFKFADDEEVIRTFNPIKRELLDLRKQVLANGRKFIIR